MHSGEIVEVQQQQQKQQLPESNVGRMRLRHGAVLQEEDQARCGRCSPVAAQSRVRDLENGEMFNPNGQGRCRWRTAAGAGYSRRPIWQGALVELMGTLVLTFVSVAAVIACLRMTELVYPRLAVAVTQFLIYTACIVVTAPISGGHLNPSFSLAVFLTGHVSLLRALLYVAAQVLGAILGALLVKSIVASDVAASYYLGGCILKQQVQLDNTGSTFATVGADAGPALVAEIFFTLLLLSIAFPLFLSSPSPGHFSNTPGSGYFHTYSDSASDPRLLRAAFVTGLLLGLLIFVSGQLLSPGYTSAGMNPARCFAPAVVQGGPTLWQPQWVFWLGPCLAALIFALLYRAVCSLGGAPSECNPNFRQQPKLPFPGDAPLPETVPNPSHAENRGAAVNQTNNVIMNGNADNCNAFPARRPGSPAVSAADTRKDKSIASPKRMDVFLHIKATVQKPDTAGTPNVEAQLEQTSATVSEIAAESATVTAVDAAPPDISHDSSDLHGRIAPAADYDNAGEAAVAEQQVILEHANLSLRDLMLPPSSTTPMLQRQLPAGSSGRERDNDDDDHHDAEYRYV